MALEFDLYDAIHKLLISAFLVFCIELFHADVDAADKNIDEFETTLKSFNLGGISLFTDVSEIENILNQQGFTLKRTTQKIKETILSFVRGKGKKSATIEIQALQDGKAWQIKVKLNDFESADFIAEETNRYSNTFEGFDSFCKSKQKRLSCKLKTDTYLYLFKANTNKYGVSYLASARITAKSKRLAQEAERKKQRQKKVAQEQAIVEKNKKERLERQQRIAKREKELGKSSSPTVENKTATLTQRELELQIQALTELNTNAISKFEQALLSFELDGISLGLKPADLLEALDNRGYTLREKTQQNSNYDKYDYRNGQSAVIVYSNTETGHAPLLKLSFYYGEGEEAREKAKAERNRMVDVFGELGNVCPNQSEFMVTCTVYTETHKLFIMGNFSRWASYEISNDVSIEAKERHQRARQQARLKILQNQKEKTIDSELSQWIATISSKTLTISTENHPLQRAITMAKTRLVEIDKLPSTLGTLSEIQKELNRVALHEIRVDGSYVKLGPQEFVDLNKQLASETNFRDYGHLIRGLADMKAKQVPRYMLDSYPNTAYGLLRFMSHFQAEAKNLFYLQPNFLGRKFVDEEVQKLIKRQAKLVYLPGIKTRISQLDSLKGKDFSGFKELKEINTSIEKLQQLTIIDTPWHGKDERQAYNDYRKKYDTIKIAMIEKSSPVLVHWIKSLPPSMKTLELLDQFMQASFDKNRREISIRFPDLASAISQKQIESNPDGYYRPEIIMSLQRGYWREVKFAGLEDVAYFMTTFKNLDQRCSGIATDGQKRVFENRVSREILNGIERMRRGQPLTKQDAEMGARLALNAIANRPGCSVDSYGNISSCISEEESRGMTEALLTSSSALSDISNFLRKNSCSSNNPRHYINNMIKYMTPGTSGATYPTIPEFPYQFSLVE